MALPSASFTYQTIAALALDKLSDVIADAISTGNAALYFYKKKDNWEGVKSGGRQLRKSVLYQLQTIRPIGSFGTVNINPVDSHTSVYYDWVQTAVPVTFSDMEEFQTSGEESIQTIVKAKFQQAKSSLDDFMSKALLRGQADIDTTSISTALTSPTDGSVFVDPFSKLIYLDPTSANTVGGVDQSTNVWWQNQYKDSTASTLSAFLSDLRYLHVRCQRGGGGANRAPDFHIVDEDTYNIYEKALSVFHQNTSFKKADIPFENVLFKNAPVIAEQLVADVKNSSTTVTKGTWYMLNSEYMGFAYDLGKSFKTGDSIRPINQLATSSLMPVRGAHWTNNRRKLGVAAGWTNSTLLAATS